jgi:hypothetical protein
MRKLFCLCFLLSAFILHANDGTYMSSGGQIYPVKEEQIRISREVLSFRVHDKVCEVSISFEFINSSAQSRKLLVGFQAPTASGDVDHEVANKCQITDFKIQSEGKLLPYQLKVAECADCELKEPGQISFSQMESGVFVFLFEMTFKPGLNRIGHCYTFPASSSVEMQAAYDYILTTGSKWAGGKIEDLTVLFDLGPNQYFFVDDVFGSEAQWSLIGTGKIGDSKEILGSRRRMVSVGSGQLMIRVLQLKPTSEIGFGILYEHSRMPDDKVTLAVESLHADEDLGKKELRLIRNTLYAKRGYVFKDQELFDYFSSKAWYFPDPNLQMKDILFTEQEKRFIERISQLEKTAK